MATAVLVILAGAAGTAGTHAVSGSYLSAVVTTVSWFGFVALFLGWLCAIGGATSAVERVERRAAAVQNIRTAA